jgi:hypothetical protein
MGFNHNLFYGKKLGNVELNQSKSEQLTCRLYDKAENQRKIKL